MDVNDIISLTETYLGNKCDKGKVRKQVATFRQKGYSLKEIYQAVQYMFDIKHNDINKAQGGIGLVPYIINESRVYWGNKEKIIEQNNKVDLSCYNNPENYTISPKPIQKPKGVKLFQLD